MTQASDTHSKTVGYVLWVFGFTGAHRFYFGKPATGTIWFFTFGLLGVGYLYDYWTLNDQITVVNAAD
jgi:TM2 domain-containing membrane protein YozV